MHTPEGVFGLPLLLGKLKVWSLYLAFTIGVRTICGRKKTCVWVCIGQDTPHACPGRAHTVEAYQWGRHHHSSCAAFYDLSHVLLIAKGQSVATDLVQQD